MTCTFITSEMLWIFRRLLKTGLPASIQGFNCHMLNFKDHTFTFRRRTWRKGQMPLFTVINHWTGRLKMRNTLLSTPEEEHDLRRKWIPCLLRALPFLLGVKTMLPQSAQGTCILPVEVSTVAFNLCHLPVKTGPQPEILDQDSVVAEWCMLTQVSAVIHHSFLFRHVKYTFIYYINLACHTVLHSVSCSGMYQILLC
jgi:hypothetical protein